MSVRYVTIGPILFRRGRAEKETFMRTELANLIPVRTAAVVAAVGFLAIAAFQAALACILVGLSLLGGLCFVVARGGNTMSDEESNALYERYAVPAASGVLADIALANLHRNPPTEVDFAKEGRIPLLFIGFGEDHIVPPKATRHNERKYEDSVSITEYKEFEGRPHFPAAPGWEEVADYAIDWAERHAGLTVADHAAAKDPASAS